MAETVEEASFEIMTSQAFRDEVVATLPYASNRALATTMYLEVDEATHELFDGLIESAGRGVRTQLQADSALYGLAPHDPGKTPDDVQRQWTKTLAMRTNLEQAGGTFRWLNDMDFLKRLTLFWNINHIRATIIDNATYLVNPNLLKHNIVSCIDEVVRIDNATLADKLDTILFSNPNKIDCPDPIIIPGVGKVVIDDSRLGSSRIHAEAYDRIANAREAVQLAVKMPPTGKLAEALHQARANGAEVDVVAGTGGYQVQRKVREFLGKTVCGSFSSRIQTPESKERHGSVHSSLLRADDTAMTATATFDLFGVMANMQEIGIFIDERPDAVTYVQDVVASVA